MGSFSTPNSNSLHKYDPKQIPIVGGTTYDFTRGDHFLVNVPQAPSWDCITYRPASSSIEPIVEGYQGKSAEKMNQGLMIDPNTELTIGDILVEQNKVIDQQHQTFLQVNATSLDLR